MSWRIILFLIVGCSGAPARPAFTPGAVATNKTFLLRRIERVRVSNAEKTSTFSVEETVAEGQGTVAKAIRVKVLENKTRRESGDVIEEIGLGGGAHVIVRPKGDGVEVFPADEYAVPAGDVTDIVSELYRFVGHPDPFLSHVPVEVKVGAPVPDSERALAQYLSGKESLFQSVEKTRSKVLSVRNDVVAIHVELSGVHRDNECTWTATPRATLTLRRSGGDLAHLELKGPLSGKCNDAEVEGELEVTIDRAPR
jgi:hypothetical protein